jgi:hypothetical protein
MSIRLRALEEEIALLRQQQGDLSPVRNSQRLVVRDDSCSRCRAWLQPRRCCFIDVTGSIPETWFNIDTHSGRLFSANNILPSSSNLRGSQPHTSDGSSSDSSTSSDSGRLSTSSESSSGTEAGFQNKSRRQRNLGNLLLVIVSAHSRL